MLTTVFYVCAWCVTVGVFFYLTKTQHHKNNPLYPCESWIERRLYKAFLRLGVKPICQKRVGPYRLDMALITRRGKFAIECDGFAYHSSPAQRKHDEKRTRFLEQRGWTVIRFSGREINQNATRCAYEVLTSAGLQTTDKKQRELQQV